MIACVNLANLLIVRAIGQGREVAIRMAIGATRAQITSDLALRGLILGVFGGAARPVVRGMDAQLPRIAGADHDATDGRRRAQPARAGLSFALAAITGIVAGLLPAVQLWRGLLIAAEIAAALTLAVGAGLLVQSMRRLAAEDLGFETKGVLLFTVNPPDTKYPDDAGRVALFEEIERRVASIPGVAAAAVANEFPLRGGGPAATAAAARVPGGEPRLLRHVADSAGARPAAGRRGSPRCAAGRRRQ